MDTRRAPDPRENDSKPELGTETVPVELVELQSVGPSGRGITRTALLAVAAIGIVAFAAIVVTGRPPTSTPSPSAPAVGLASATPAPTPTPTPTVAPSTFRPSVAPPTPRPTPPPPWQWTRIDFFPDLASSVEGIWGVDGKLLALIRRYDPAGDRESWSIARQVEADGWELLPAPPAIVEFLAGTVIDDRLWFFARVGGITDADTTWQLISTEDGMTWDSLGTSEGLPPFDAATTLARTGDTWMMVTERFRGEGASNGAISWSVDGRHWTPADVPDLRANVGYTGAASIGDATVLVGFDFDVPEDADWFAMRSTDGRVWRRTSFALPSTSSARDLACDDRICIITLQAFGSEAASTQTLMVSTDGDHWAEVDVNVPSNGTDATIGLLTTTATGFIALTGSPAQALLSTDGSLWRVVEVLPPDADVYISDLAVAGDQVVALVPWQTSDDPIFRIWVGSLAAMEVQRR